MGASRTLWQRLRFWNGLFALAGLHLLFSASAATAQFLPLVDEARNVATLIKCPSPRLQIDAGQPPLWSCLLPPNEVAKVFINGDKGKGVESVKIMWNDWTKDIGYGVHTDRQLAEAWVTALATRYAPEMVPDVLEAFRGVQPVLIRGSAFDLRYTYGKGPAMAERLITITAR